jgi:hypothetical protein
MEDRLTGEVRDLRARMRRFIDEEVIPREPELLDRDGRGQGALAELKATAKAQGCGRWATRRRSAAAACRSCRSST